MSYATAERDRRAMLATLSMALTSLAAAGAHVIKVRQYCPPEAQPLVTGIRDDISAMMSHVEALREVALGKN